MILPAISLILNTCDLILEIIELFVFKKDYLKDSFNYFCVIGILF
jgi:hypothetical protein